MKLDREPSDTKPQLTAFNLLLARNANLKTPVYASKSGNKKRKGIQ